MATYQEFLPTRRLARYIECYWSSVDRNGARCESVLPDGCVDILYSARGGEPIDVSLVGLMTVRQLIDVESGVSLFGVRFRPGMAAAFFPDAPQLIDRTERIESVMGAGARTILEQLSESSSPASMAQIFDAFLRPLEPPDMRETVMHQLTVSGMPLDRAATEAGLSVRHLRRLCQEMSGVPPKYLARIIRFRNAANRIATLATAPAQPDWAQFAIACGYYDQAHLIREFQEFARCTPGRYLQYAVNRDSLVSRS